MTALIIPCFNRPLELKRCFDSLKQARWPDNTICILIDDASTDADTKKLFSEFHIEGIEIIRFINPINKGIKASLLKGYDFAFRYGAKIVINLDSDAIVKPDFFEQLLKSNILFPDHIVTGFNSVNKNRDGSERHEIVYTADNYHLKKSVGGINMVTGKECYEQFIKPSLLEENTNWDHRTSIRALEANKPMVCLFPSVVQHIASSSAMQHNEEPDVACDFYSLKLDKITLIGADTNHFQELEKAARISQNDIMYGAVKMLNPPEVKSASDYNHYCMKRFNEHVETDYALVVQWDGYVLSHLGWRDEFYDYDYIGATWQYKDNMNVGNGGFSFRSKKLLEILATDKELTQFMPEDHQICKTYRPYLEKKYAIKFAPEEVANRFSIEAYGSILPGANKYNGQFGFHGFNVDYTGSGLAHIPQQPQQQIKHPLRNNIMRGATIR